MARTIFVNLPVADLPRATAFYEAIGATRNAQFSDETGACLVFSDTINVMLLTHAKYGEFTSLPIADARATSQMLLSITTENRAEVDAMTERALAAGGREPSAAKDYGFMYGRTFEDLDGHIWEPLWVDMATASAEMAPAEQKAA